MISTGQCLGKVWFYIGAQLYSVPEKEFPCDRFELHDDMAERLVASSLAVPDKVPHL